MSSRSVVERLGALVLLACIVGVGAAGLGSVTIGGIGSPLGRYHHSGIGELVATSRVCQTFVAQYDGLFQIRVTLDYYGRESSGPFHLHLGSIPDASQGPDAAENIVSLTHDASEVVQEVPHIFEFAPIDDSGGKRYVFCLEAPEASLDSAITATGWLTDWYPDGKATFRDMWGEAAGVQDLDFYLEYRLSLWDKLRVLSQRLVANKPFLCGAGWFYVLLGAAYLALLYSLLARFIPKP